LSIAKTNDQVRISWPLSAGGFILEEADSLESLWTAVPPPYETNATGISVTVQSVGQAFYHLSR
jgi:hypothetical protein